MSSSSSLVKPRLPNWVVFMVAGYSGGGQQVTFSPREPCAQRNSALAPLVRSLFRLRSTAYGRDRRAAPDPPGAIPAFFASLRWKPVCRNPQTPRASQNARLPTENCRALSSTLLVQLRGTEMPGRLHVALRSTRRLLSRFRDIGFHHPTSSGTPSSESARRNCSACSYE